MNGKTLILAGILAYVALWWAAQPTCHTGEVRVRGVFMTACVAGHGGRIP